MKTRNLKTLLVAALMAPAMVCLNTSCGDVHIEHDPYHRNLGSVTTVTPQTLWEMRRPGEDALFAPPPPTPLPPGQTFALAQ